MNWVKVAHSLRRKQKGLYRDAAGAETRHRTDKLNIEANAVGALKEALLEGMTSEDRRAYDKGAAAEMNDMRR